MMADSQEQTACEPVIIIQSEDTEQSGGISALTASSIEEKKGILKKRGRTLNPEDRSKRTSSGIQWDEMNILLTEHPPDKDYGHMKIDEPKTPYHELIDEEVDAAGTSGVAAEELADHVMQVQNEEDTKSKWERESESSDDEMLTDEALEKKRKFKEWRKAHYNEYAAVQRARQLMKEDEEELRRLEEEEKMSEEMEHQS